MRPLYYTGNAATPQPATYVLRLDNQDWLRGALLDALNSLAVPENWQQVGDIDQRQAAEFGAYIVQYFDLAVDMLGMIMPFCGSVADMPNGALVCNGATYNIADYRRLANMLGFFEPDDTTFQVPDLRGSFVVGANQGSGIGNNPAHYPYYVRQNGGTETRTLTVGQLPAHTHIDAGHTHVDAGHTHGYVPALPSVQEVTVGVPAPAAVPGASATAPGFASIQSASANIQNTGNGDPVNIVPPYYAFAWIIIAQWGSP